MDLQSVYLCNSGWYGVIPVKKDRLKKDIWESFFEKGSSLQGCKQEKINRKIKETCESVEERSDQRVDRICERKPIVCSNQEALFKLVGLDQSDSGQRLNRSVRGVVRCDTDWFPTIDIRDRLKKDIWEYFFEKGSSLQGCKQEKINRKIKETCESVEERSDQRVDRICERKPIVCSNQEALFKLVGLDQSDSGQRLNRTVRG
ncbi:hypothetical protein L1987_08637 [Smallanthus sonchifolius]|uniref:Uncharacterized protein n=1 Tax=Smallanthus sonchifolius TaxID=185202 RepID=A0ACB9JMV2_9ASTR|nr:hypothetical protein L1987_08637 [Smallanthus sonchifolius]